MFIKKLAVMHPNWFVHEVIACDPVTFEPVWHQKYTRQHWIDKNADMGTIFFRAEYLHIAIIVGKIFKPEETQWCKLPRIDHFDIIVGHWDIAYAGTPTSDYNAVRVWGLKGKAFYFINCFVKQTKMRQAVDWMCNFQKMLPNGVYVHWRYEAQFWNDEVQRTINDSEAANNVELGIVKVDTPRGKKYDRILTLQPYFQNGRIFYNIKMKAHNDSSIGLEQLYAIQPGYNTHDDAPDADQQAISFLSPHIEPNSGNQSIMGKYEPEARFL